MGHEKQRKLKSMLVLTLLFFFVELICGYASGSLALISDSFHMLSDVASFVIALYASKMAKTKNHSKALSYGLKRAEVLGALINGVSLLALCFTLVISAIQRFVTPEEIENPKIVLVVAIVGLGVNIIGMFMFHDHSHHGHSNGSHSHDSTTIEGHSECDSEDMEELPIAKLADIVQAVDFLADTSASTEHETLLDIPHSTSHRDMNIHGVFLHIMGDFLGSVGVVLSTLCVLLFNQPWTIYVDPFMSLFITCIIVTSSIPLVKAASFILLQGAPEFLPVEDIKKTIADIPGIIGIHEFHIWQLADKQSIASIHVSVSNHVSNADYMVLAGNIKQKLHRYGIHSTTIQPEFVEPKSLNGDQASNCWLRCESDECEDKTCCS